jgi:deazaflavin-dependent oxidoreductase (nitroreductase family)
MNALTPLAISIGGLPWLPRFLRQITTVDKLIQRITRGRWSLLRLAGLPGLMLTVAGRKSGLPRSTPVLFVPYGDSQLVAGSNFGGPKQPVWVVNLRAAGRATVTVDGTSRDVVAHELAGEEREAAWAQMLQTWPNYAKYAERTSRVIPVFRLDPAR